MGGVYCLSSATHNVYASPRTVKNNSAWGGQMSYKKREVEPLGYSPEQTIRPAPFPGKASQRMIPRRFSGWDPYEVWRTRVKAQRNLADEILGLDKAG